MFGIPKRYERLRLEKLEVSKKIVQRCLKYTEQYPNFKPNEREGLFFFGEARGAGKTALAVCVLLKLLELGKIKHRVYRKPVPELLSEIRKTYGKHDETAQESDIIDRVLLSDVVVLDDLGTERQTEWTSEKLYLMINHRYEEQKPTIYTSNYSLDQLEAERGVDSKITSRIAGSCELIEIKGEDYRVKRK